MATYPTPFAATYSKLSAGLSDATCSSGIYKFLGCTVLSVNASLGFNSTSSSLSVTLVEDSDPHEDLYSQTLGGVEDLDINELEGLPYLSADNFQTPVIPSIHSFSLPSGGVGTPIYYQSYDLNQADFYGGNVPLYFCGILTSYQETKRDISGRIINVNLVDPREVLSGVQCLLSGFALSQNIGVGANRYSDVNNVIDVFGYFNYGWESGANEYGMPWYKIKQALEAVGCKIHDMTFEFYFTGDCFTDTPAWYRIEDQVIDVVSLAQRVARDGGSDLVVVARKVNANAAVVEFRGIKRENVDPLFTSEISGFITSRQDIVNYAKTGREFKNEAESSVVIGGMKNSNYVAWPSEYEEDMHLSASGTEDYNKFPHEITARLFGGSGTVINDSAVSVLERIDTFNLDSGAIFPFWGFAPSGEYYPLIEPFLSLDHMVFSYDTAYKLNFRQKIPLCKLEVEDFSVRNVFHSDVFLTGDGDPDSRPFTRLRSYKFEADNEEGYIRGLPLNTEVLRAAMIGKDAFEATYSIYYPAIASGLEYPTPNWKSFRAQVEESISIGEVVNPENFPIEGLLGHSEGMQNLQAAIVDDIDTVGKVDINNANIQAALGKARQINGILNLQSLIYQHVRQYAIDNMGQKFLVCLPKSFIMNRIWDGLEVPTRTERPEIEYIVDDKGYWTYVPTEFDGVARSASGVDAERQIRNKFMAEDGRFYPIAVMDYKPTGNINFNSNGINSVMFQDLPTSEFRPNKIADANPSFVCIACNVNQLERRPDLALVQLPATCFFDPTDGFKSTANLDMNIADDEFLIRKGSIMKYLWRFVQKNNDLRAAIQAIATQQTSSFNTIATKFVKNWAGSLRATYGTSYFQYSNATEPVMDLKAVIIPLKSVWMPYGPWYTEYNDAKGMVRIDVDQNLVPWNFARPSAPSGWDAALNLAGEEKVTRSLARLEYVDNANITVAGYPEFGLSSPFGYNSNISSISIDFGLGGIKTTYNLATYDAIPGTYRKSDYDNLDRARIDTRPKVQDVVNHNLLYMPDYDGTNRFGS